MYSTYRAIIPTKSVSGEVDIPSHFLVFAQKISYILGRVYGVEVVDDSLEGAVSTLQRLMPESSPVFIHLYDALSIIVIFKDRYFLMSKEISSWREAIQYGLSKGIPVEHLDFYPASEQEEYAYFAD